MVTLEDIQNAVSVVRGVAHHTPILTSDGIAKRVAGHPDRADLVFKAENFQRTGSFKIRGATYKMARLTADERARGVAAASAGNHAQGVALAAHRLGVTATVFMPQFASIAKIKATEGYGARVILAGAGFDDAVAACRAFTDETGAVYVSAYDDDDIIAGQGTLGLELLEDVPDVATVIVPIGGGGLFAGVATAIKEHRPDVRLIGVQSEGADTAARSFRAGALVERSDPVRTICDGIAIKAPSPRTFRHIQKYADDVVTVPDTAVSQAILLLLERAKVVVEPSGAAGLAALLAGRTPAAGKTAVILCGGNIDALTLADLTQREMLLQGRYVHLLTACDDRPGGLVRLLGVVADEGGSVVTVNHDRLSPRVALGMTAVELLIEVRDAAHGARIAAALSGMGYPVDARE